MNKEQKFFKGLIRNISTCCARVSWIKPHLKVAVVNALLLVVFSCSFSIGDGMYIDNPDEVELGVESVGEPASGQSSQIADTDIDTNSITTVVDVQNDTDLRTDAELVTNTTFDVQDSGTALDIFEFDDDSEELYKQVDIKNSISIATSQTSSTLVTNAPVYNYLSLTKQLPIIRT